jgi:hypothetical protein
LAGVPTGLWHAANAAVRNIRVGMNAHPTGARVT